MGSPEVPAAAAAERIVSFYRDRCRPALVQVELGGDVEHELAELGWVPVPDRDVHFELGSVSSALRRLGDLAGGSPSTEGSRISVRLGGAVAGRAVVDGDWVGLHDVGPDGGVLATLLEVAASQGALTAWAHVPVEDASTAALYEAAGFGIHHSCRYLASSPEDAAAVRSDRPS